MPIVVNIGALVNEWYCFSMALLTVYKKIGETPLQALERLRIEKNLSPDEKMTYAGRLDPAAEGLLLVLTAHDVHQKESFLSLDKTYEFSVLFGIATDSLDCLGLVTQTQFANKDVAMSVLGVLDSFVGEFEWEYPKFSSKPVQGVPLFQHARNNKDVEIPKRTMKICSLEIVDRSFKFLHEFRDQIETTVRSVEGDFRQDEILDRWEKVFEDYGDKKVGIMTFRANVSSGTYVRVLAEKLGSSLGLPSFALAIKRTSIGTIEISK